MSNESVVNMVDALQGGDNVAAQDAFKSALTDKIGMALDAKRQTVANDWLNAGDEMEAIEAGSELSGQSSFDDVAAEVDEAPKSPSSEAVRMPTLTSNMLFPTLSHSTSLSSSLLAAPASGHGEKIAGRAHSQLQHVSRFEHFDIADH